MAALVPCTEICVLRKVEVAGKLAGSLTPVFYVVALSVIKTVRNASLCGKSCLNISFASSIDRTLADVSRF